MLVRKGCVILLSGLKIAVNSPQVLLAFGQTMGTPEWEATVPPLPAESNWYFVGNVFAKMAKEE